jgi:hypothetical protein
MDRGVIDGPAEMERSRACLPQAGCGATRVGCTHCEFREGL